MPFDTIRLDQDRAVAILTLDRPEKLNSFTWAMHQEVKAALAEVEASGARALVLTGAGRGFCAGQDLSDPEFSIDPSYDIGRTLDHNYNPLLRKLRGLRMPVIAAVNGIAAGAGANVALACDIVLAARSASFLQAFTRIGLIPDSGGTWTLTRALGEARAKGLAMLAEPLSAETAEAWGLIWKAVDDDALMEEATALARDLAARPTAALALVKEAIHAAAVNNMDTQLDLERDFQRKASRTEDYREGVAAFLEKRKPSFKGR